MTHLKKPEPVEICWRVIEGSTTRILTCAIFAASDESVELRVGYFGGLPLHSQTMRDIASARALAQQWRDAVRAIELRHDLQLSGLQPTN
jgi:hypothetical protein